MTAAASQPHFLLFPFPCPGHTNPFFHLSTQLHLLGASITFVTTSAFLDSHLEFRSLPAENDIRFVAIPPLPPGDLPPNLLLHVLENYEGMLEDLIASSRSTSSPISCFIADPLCPWTERFAEKVGIPRALLWTGAARLLQIGLFPTSKERQASHECATLQQDGLTQETSEFVSLVLGGIEKIACILVNSFDGIEPVPTITSSIPSLDIKLVGPLLPPFAFCEEIEKRDGSCLSWLNKHEPCSVLYISFGSIFDLPQPQLEQLMMGIEGSNQPFIWVRRLDQMQLPEDFLERTENRGLVVPWAPQLDVLRHPSLSGFLTHCGWNSVVESIVAGVPMLCFPIIADQHMNAYMVAREWGVGLEAKKGENGVVESKEVERMIKALIGGEEDVHKRVKEMASACRARRNGQNCSLSNLTRFIQDIRDGKREDDVSSLSMSPFS